MALQSFDSIMATKSKAKKEAAVYGYIRTKIDVDDDMNIPDSIKNLIAFFLALWFDIDFKWDTYRGRFDDSTKIDGGIIHFYPRKAGHWRTVLYEKPISGEEYSKYEWEITLTKWMHSSYRSKWCGVGMGYIPMKAYENKKEYNYGENLGQIWESDELSVNFLSSAKYVTVNEYNPDSRYGYSKWQKLESMKCELNQGDKCKLVFDFEEKEIRACYNDKLVEVVRREIPDKFVPAVTLYKCEIECTMFMGLM